ncbi:hypothetical protein [Kineococcus terrestris]|uniref:hypothetical protein n=1 Tax=Kineococcus terrestris TaxID=2044856 RepID=UPI0034DABCB2
MSEQPDQPTLDDVIDPEIAAPRDRQEHAKAPARPSDDELEQRVEHERREVGLGGDGGGDGGGDVPPATD